MARVKFTEAQLKKLGIHLPGNSKERKPKKQKVQARENPDYAFFPVLVEKDLGVEVVREHPFHPERKWRFDYAILRHRIAVEVEGGVFTQGRHTRGVGMKADMEKYNAAASLGWRLYRVTPDQLISTKTFDVLRELINNGANDQ